MTEETKNTSEPSGVKESQETDFTSLIADIQKALQSEKGARLACKVARINDSQSLVIYQGLRSNVWARIERNGNYFIYRSSLERLLRSHEATKKYFQNQRGKL